MRLFSSGNQYPRKTVLDIGVPAYNENRPPTKRGSSVKGLPEERAISLAQYIIENEATVRQAAARFGVSKSTVHKDITSRLEHLNRILYIQVQQVLSKNKNERHIRGGMATREKYRKK